MVRKGSPTLRQLEKIGSALWESGEAFSRFEKIEFYTYSAWGLPFQLGMFKSKNIKIITL